MRSHRLRTAGPNGDRGDGMTAEFLPSRLPIIQAPMAGSQGVELCVAVSEAGGLGSIPSAMLTPTTLRDQIAEIRGRTKAPFNVNFFCRAPFDVAMAEVVEATRPSVVSFHFGLPDGPLLARVKAGGAKIYASATTV